MINKFKITQKFLEEAGLETDDKTVKKYYNSIWKNTRSKQTGGLGLTNTGFDFLKNKLNLNCYKVCIKENTILTNQLIVWLNNFIDSPYYIKGDTIFVFSEKLAVQLILYRGNLEHFLKAKKISSTV